MNQIYTIDPLFDFQCLCDIDLGLYRLIREEYYDRNIFNNYLFDSNDLRFIKTMLLSRKEFNPLFIFCKKDKLSNKDIDDLYNQFLENEYEKIIELSPPTLFMHIASSSNSINKVVNVIVLCKNNIEVKWLNKYNHKLKYIISDYINFDLEEYDTLYLKNIYDLELFKKESIENKNIIIPRFNFNLENYSKMEIPIIDITKNYYENNNFMVADPYKDIWVPVSIME